MCVNKDTDLALKRQTSQRLLLIRVVKKRRLWCLRCCFQTNRAFACSIVAAVSQLNAEQNDICGSVTSDTFTIAGQQTTNTHAEAQARIRTHSRAGRQALPRYTHGHRQTERQADRHRQADRDRQKDRQTDIPRPLFQILSDKGQNMHARTHKHTHTQTCKRVYNPNISVCHLPVWRPQTTDRT